MNKIVYKHYPVRKLPEELREGFDLDGSVTVTIGWEESPHRPATREEDPGDALEAEKTSD